MTAVDDLREAAALLRSRVADIPDWAHPTWRAVHTDSESATGVAMCPQHAGPNDHVCDRCDEVETYSVELAAYLTTVQPSVGLALAAVLDDHAALAARWPDDPLSPNRRALVDAILGTGRGRRDGI